MYLLLLFLSLTASAGDKARFSVAASDSLSTVRSCELLGKIPATDAASRALTDGAYLSRLRGKLTSIVTAVSITWWLAKDSDGEDELTDKITVTIVDDDADGNGGVNSPINTGFVVDGDTTKTDVYVCATTNAGTATVVSRLIWEAR